VSEVRVTQKSRRLGLVTIVGVNAGSAPLCLPIRRAFVAENLTKPTVKQDTVRCSDVLTNEKNVETVSSFSFRLDFATGRSSLFESCLKQSSVKF
jgi:hypothetical protein